MIILVPQFNHSDVVIERFTVTEGLYISLCGKYEVRVEDETGNQIEPLTEVDGIRFKLWKYKDCLGQWIEFKPYRSK